MKCQSQPKEIVRAFLLEVRSGKHPERASIYMADMVLAHQVQSENPVTLKRSPASYEAHVRDFLKTFGSFDFEITELLAEGNKVYARWKQTGKHLMAIDSYEPTGKILVEYTSAVYLIENGKITSYWLQTDRAGMEAQLIENKCDK